MYKLYDLLFRKYYLKLVHAVSRLFHITQVGCKFINLSQIENLKAIFFIILYRIRAVLLNFQHDFGVYFLIYLFSHQKFIIVLPCFCVSAQWHTWSIVFKRKTTKHKITGSKLFCILNFYDIKEIVVFKTPLSIMTSTVCLFFFLFWRG